MKLAYALLTEFIHATATPSYCFMHPALKGREIAICWGQVWNKSQSHTMHGVVATAAQTVGKYTRRK